MITAKVKCWSKVDNTGSATKTLQFGPDYANGANKEWATATPGLNLHISMVDAVADQFEVGGAYTLTFTPSEDPAPAQ